MEPFGDMDYPGVIYLEQAPPQMVPGDPGVIYLEYLKAYGVSYDPDVICRV